MNEDKEEHIIVAVRMRPLNAKEKNENNECEWSFDTENNRVICDQPARLKSQTNSYIYDRVYPPQATTEAVYNGIGRRIVDSFVHGMNGTIFAYGQTSSGKTYTMHGDESSPGFLYLASRDIFEYIQKSISREFILRVSYLEVYRENLRDLLSDKSGPVKVQTNVEGSVQVDCTEVVTHSYEELMRIMSIGDQNRHFGVTNMNEQSSRSHTIFRLICESRERMSDEAAKQNSRSVIVGTLNLVDLAGSESQKLTEAKGITFEEAKKINLSLSILSRVISQLSSSSSHVSYRDSVLTRVLQPSLEGNSKTAVIACASPATAYLSETENTLMFAHRAKNVRTSAKVNEVVDDKEQIRRLRQEVLLLKKMLDMRSEEDTGESVISTSSGATAESEESEESKESEDNVTLKEKELIEAQERLEHMDKDMKEHALLLSRETQQRSNLEAELSLLQNNHNALQNKMLEVLTANNDMENRIKGLEDERETLLIEKKEQTETMGAMLAEIESIHKRDQGLLQKAKNLSSIPRSSGLSLTLQDGNNTYDGAVESEDIESMTMKLIREIESLYEERQRNRKDLESAQQIIDQLNNVAKEWDGERLERNKEIERIGKELVDMKSEKDGLEKEMEEKNALVEQMKRELGESHDRMDTVAKELRISKMKCDNLESVYRALGAEMKTLEEKEKAFLKTIEEGKRENEELQKQNNEEMGRVEEGKKNYDRIVLEKNEIERRLFEAVKSNEEMRRQILDSTSMVEQYQVEIRSLVAAMDASDGDVQKLKETIDKRAEEIGKMKRVEREQQGLVASLMKANKEMKKECSQLKMEIDILKRAEDEAEDNRQMVEDWKKEWEERMARVDAEVEERREQEMEEMREEVERERRRMNEISSIPNQRSTLDGGTTDRSMSEHSTILIPPSTPSHSKVNYSDDGKEAKEAIEAIERLKREVEEKNEKMNKYKETIQAKYKEYKEMKSRVSELEEQHKIEMEIVAKLEEYSKRVSNDCKQAEMKLISAEARCKQLEKSKLDTGSLERIKKVLASKEKLKNNNSKLQKLLSEEKKEKEYLEMKNSELSTSVIELKKEVEKRDLTIIEMQTEIKEKKEEQSVGNVTSKEFLQEENMRLLLMIDKLKGKIKELERHSKKSSARSDVIESPGKRRKRESKKEEEKGEEVTVNKVFDTEQCTKQ